jgi:diguanylate cyclase (GGDEF)-like protein
MLDIDHFKKINDTWGHAAGDEVLRSVTERWTRQIRASDVLVRLGGEEFAVILVRSYAQQALQVANKILDITRSTPIRYKIEGIPVDLSVTISIGLASERTLRDIDIQVLMNNADRALYRAKSSGRNRVEVAPREMAPHNRTGG